MKPPKYVCKVWYINITKGRVIILKILTKKKKKRKKGRLKNKNSLGVFSTDQKKLVFDFGKASHLFYNEIIVVRRK